MIELDSIWKEMEIGSSPSAPGKFIRRIYPETRFDLFITLKKPSNHRALKFEVPLDSLSGITELPSTRVLTSRLDKYQDTGKALLEIELVNSGFSEVFTILVNDLSAVIIASENDQVAISQFLARLHHWIFFLEHSGPEGLSPEAQRGLYGELWFLEKILLSQIDNVRAITAWTGANAAPQDFQLPGVAVEVKVTSSKLPQNLLISNERQLDDTSVNTLYLLHLSLDVRKGSDETLNNIIDSLRSKLKPSIVAHQMFELALFKVGYLDNQRARYDSPGYFVLNSTFFHVTTGFPRIIESDLPSGVGNVHYSIERSACLPFIVDNQAVISTILTGA